MGNVIRYILKVMFNSMDMHDKQTCTVVLYFFTVSFVAHRIKKPLEICAVITTTSK